MNTERENHYAPVDQNDSEPVPTSVANRVKLLVFVAFAIILGFLIFQFGDELSLEKLAQREAALRGYQADHPVLVYGIAFCIYVTVTGFSLPGAAALTLVFGWYFGFWPALVLISFASTIGATLAFLLSRYLVRDTVQSKFGDKLQSFNEHLERDGAFYLFTLRLIPAVPFFVINLVMGLTPLKTRTFYWVSQVGMLPGTAVYTYAGSRVPDLNTLAKDGASAVFSPMQLIQITIAFAMLGAFPLIMKFALKRFAKNSAHQAGEPQQAEPSDA